MGFLLFLVITVIIYNILSLIVGIIGGFGAWDFTLLRDLIIFWTTPQAEMGAFWKAFILFCSLGAGASAVIELSDNNNYNYTLQKANHDDYQHQVQDNILERTEPTTEPPKEREVNILV